MVLTVDAAVAGVIDYRQARLHDPQWWRYFRVMLQAFERQRDFAIYDARYRHVLSLLGNSGLTEDSFNKQQEQANEAFYDLIGTLQPWSGQSYQERKAKQFGDARKDFMDAFGYDPTSPEFKKFEAEQFDKLITATDATETDEDRIARKILERDTRGKR